MTKSNRRVDEEDVKHIASLARIQIQEDDIEGYIEQFDKILDRFEKLDDVDPKQADNKELENIVRPDVLDDSLTQEQALENSTKTTDGYFEGPSVN